MRNKTSRRSMLTKLFSSRGSICALMVAVLLCSLSLSGCMVPPAFEGGVRFFTQEQLFDATDLTLPISDAQAAGVVVAILGPGSGAQSVGGTTDVFGVADFPNAYGYATWQVSLRYQLSSAPGCPTITQTYNGGPTGFEWDVTCIVQ
jgi:hypothetical protein